MKEAGTGRHHFGHCCGHAVALALAQLEALTPAFVAQPTTRPCSFRMTKPYSGWRSAERADNSLLPIVLRFAIAFSR